MPKKDRPLISFPVVANGDSAVVTLKAKRKFRVSAIDVGYDNKGAGGTFTIAQVLGEDEDGNPKSVVLNYPIRGEKLLSLGFDPPLRGMEDDQTDMIFALGPSISPDHAGHLHVHAVSFEEDD